MFTKLFVAVLALLISNTVKSEPIDSTVRVLQAEVSRLTKRIDSFFTLQSSPTNATPGNGKLAENVSNSCNSVDFFSLEGILITAPILLLISLFIYLVRRLRKENFQLSEALSTFRPSKTTTVNKTFLADGSSSRQEDQHAEDKMVRSTSRSIAFLTAAVALIIAIVVTSYSGYHAITGCGSTVSVNDLWKLLASLGIGVIPYGVNVLGGNKKEEPTPPTT